MSDVICLKLMSGEEVVGKLVERNIEYIKLKDVASIIMMPGGQTGQVGLGLMPFLPYAENKAFHFSRSLIMIDFDPNIDMLNNYNRMFGSGIQIARGM